jgi:hypothetical protein
MIRFSNRLQQPIEAARVEANLERQMVVMVDQVAARVGRVHPAQLRQRVKATLAAHLITELI